MLFNILTNTFSSATDKAKLTQYTDDSTLICSSTNLTDLKSVSQHALHSTEEWLEDAHLIVNPKKTNLLLFLLSVKSTNFPAFSISSRNRTIITNSSSTKLLCIHIDNKLSFEAHINASIKKTNQQLGTLYRSQQFLTNEARFALASAILFPSLLYGSVIFSKLYVTLLNKLCQTYNKISKFASNTKFSTHHCTALKSLNWLELPNLLHLNQLCMAFKIIHNLSKCPVLANMLTSYSPPRNLQSQDLHLLSIPKWFKSPGLSIFSFIIPKLWNALPPTVISTNTFQAFKSLLKQHLFNQWLCLCSSPS